MQYNKLNSNKVNERKILRKVKKNWLIVSLSVFGAITIGNILNSEYNAYADVSPEAIHTTTTSPSSTSSVKSSSAINIITSSTSTTINSTPSASSSVESSSVSSPSTTSKITSVASSSIVSNVAISLSPNTSNTSAVTSNYNTSNSNSSNVNSATSDPSYSVFSSANVSSIQSSSSDVDPYAKKIIDSLKNEPLVLYLSSKAPTDLVNIDPASNYVTPLIEVIYTDVDTNRIISAQYINMGGTDVNGGDHPLVNNLSYDGWPRLPYKQGDNFHVNLNKKIPEAPNIIGGYHYNFVNAAPYLFSNYSLDRSWFKNGIRVTPPTNQDNNIPRVYDPNPDGGFPAIKGTSQLQYHYVSDTDASISGKFSLLNNSNLSNGTPASEDFNALGGKRQLTDGIVIPLSLEKDVSGSFGDGGIFYPIKNGLPYPEFTSDDDVNDVSGSNYDPNNPSMDSSITPIHATDNSGVTNDSNANSGSKTNPAANNNPANDQNKNNTDNNANGGSKTNPAVNTNPANDQNKNNADNNANGGSKTNPAANNNPANDQNKNNTDNNANGGPKINPANNNAENINPTNTNNVVVTNSNANSSSASNDSLFAFYNGSSNSSNVDSKNYLSNSSYDYSKSSSLSTANNSSVSQGSVASSSSVVSNKTMYNDKSKIVKINNELRIDIEPKYANIQSNGSLANKYVINRKDSNGKLYHDQLLTLNQFNSLLTASGKKTITYDELVNAYSSNSKDSFINVGTTFNASTTKVDSNVVINTNGNDSGFSKSNYKETTSKSKTNVSKTHHKHSTNKKHHIKNESHHHSTNKKHHIKNKSHHHSKDKRKNVFKLSYR